MVVDDVPTNLEILEEILSSQGYSVRSFTSGYSAFSSALNSPPDLILLDIMMPEINGFELCQQFKDNPTLKDIPVIFISALNDTENIVKAFTQGGVDYITKPFKEGEVFARIKTHLNLREVQHELEVYSSQLENLVLEKVQEISDSQLATLIALSNLAEFRDKTTGKHLDRTREFCRLISSYLSQYSKYASLISASFIDDIFHAAPLHDIGKVGIPDSILLKPGKLTSEEYEIMKTHVTIGAATLERILLQYPKNSFINMGVLLTKYHHERWDGGGYPEGLKGHEIPLPARIMMLADIYDALRSKRPYKDGFSHEESKQIIINESEKTFDPEIVQAFLALEKQFDDIFNSMNG